MREINIKVIEEKYEEIPQNREEQLYFLSCIKNLIKAESYENVVKSVFNRTIEFFGAEHTYIFALNDTRNSWGKIGEQYACEETSERCDIKQIEAHILEAWNDRFEQQAMVTIWDVKELRKDSKRQAEYELLSSLNVKNLVAVPIVYDGLLQAFFAVENITQNAEYINSMLSVAYYIANGVSRFKTVEQLKLEKNKAEESCNMLKTIVGKDDSKNLTAAVLHGVSELYYAIYFIQVKTQSYTCFREAWNTISEDIQTTGEYSAAFRTYIECYIDERDRQKMYEFSNFDTVLKRLKEERSISQLYRRKGIGWTRGQYIVSETDAEGNIISILYTVTDINEEKENEIKKAESEYKATHDEATGMLNREGLSQVSSEPKYKYYPVGMMVVDVAMFERIMNQNGKEHGREIINIIVECLKIYSGEQNQIAYLGGDTFVILFADNEKKKVSKQFDNICKKISEIHMGLGKFDNDDTQITINAGVVYSPDGYSDEVFRMAYNALLLSTQNGRGCCTLVDMTGKCLKQWYDTNLHLRRDVAFANSKTGAWSIEFASKAGGKHKMYGDKIMKMLLGVSEDITPEEMYQHWETRIDPEYRDTVFEMVDRVIVENHAEVTYYWNHPTLGRRNVRCGGSLDVSNANKNSIYGYHQDLMDISIVRKQDDSNLIINAMSKAYFCNYYINLIDGTYTTYNELYSVNHGIASSGVVKQSVDEFVDELVAEESKNRICEFMDVSTLEKRLEHTDFIDCEFLSTGDKGWCRATFIPVKWDKAKKHLTHVMFVIAVIDEAKVKELELQRKVQEALKEAEQANNAKTDFLSRMSHDIRTPMNAVLGMTALAMSNIDNKEKVYDSLKKINVSGKHLLALINEVLDMRKIESGAIQLNKEEFNLSEFIHNYLILVHSEMAEHLHTFNVHIGTVNHELVIGDTLRLRQILINLSGNAVKYTPDGGTIHFTLNELSCEQPNKAKYQFEIEDNGIGMSEEFLTHIYEPFTRANDTRTNKIQGTGLGLTIVNNLVKLMNGDIEIESELDKGTKFTVTILLDLQKKEDSLEAFYHLYSQENEQSQDYEGMDEIQELKQVSYTGKRALVVEDQEFNREIAEEFLCMAGLKVECAENGQEALDLLFTSEVGYFDIVFMDIQMPVMNGYDATKHIRSCNREDLKLLPVIAMSANAFVEDVNTSLENGMNEHIAKPIDIPKLRKVLEQWL